MIAGAVLVSEPVGAGTRKPDLHTYTIRHDRGGSVASYLQRVQRLDRQDRAVAFDGRCDSACTLFLGLQSSKVCITPRGKFGFHLPYGSSAIANRVAANLLINSYPYWVRDWLNKRGGLSVELKVMPYSYARMYIRNCRDV